MLSTGSAAEKDSAFGKLHIGSGGIGAMAGLDIDRHSSPTRVGNNGG